MIFDGHTDILTDIVRRRENKEEDVFRKYHFPKWKKGGIGGAIFVIWIDPPYTSAPKQRLEQVLQAMHKELEQAKDILFQVKYKKDFMSHKEKVHMVLGMEGLSHVDEESGTEALNRYYDLGLRHASLTWNEQNAIATGIRGEETRGLTPFGKKVVRKLNELGVILDVSHLNERSFWDIVDISDQSFIASHSNASSLFEHRRNLKDEQIKEIGRRGGLVGINSYKGFIAAEERKQNIDNLALHAARIADLIGTDHLVLGMDFCDFLDKNPEYLEGMRGAEEAKNIIGALQRAGFLRDEIEQILWKNYKKYIDKIWKK